MAQVRSANADDEVALVGSIVIKQKDLTLTNLCEVEGNVRNRQKHESKHKIIINKIMSISK